MKLGLTYHTILPLNPPRRTSNLMVLTKVARQPAARVIIRAMVVDRSFMLVSVENGKKGVKGGVARVGIRRGESLHAAVNEV